MVVEQPASSVLTGHRAFKHLNYLLGCRKMPATGFKPWFAVRVFACWD